MSHARRTAALTAIVAALALGACQTGATTSPGTTPGAPSVALPTLPSIEVPSVEVPSIEVPSVEVPSVEVPSVEVPSVEVPSVEIPSVEIPSFEIPSFEIPSGLPSFEIPSFEIPTFHADPELEGRIPGTVGGQTIETQSISGADFGSTGGEDFQAFLTSLGKQPSDVTLAVGQSADRSLSITAFRVAGVEGQRALDELIRIQQGNADEPVTVSQANIGGKNVTTILEEGADPATETQYIYASGDVFFQVGGSNQALVTEAITQLP